MPRHRCSSFGIGFRCRYLWTARDEILPGSPRRPRDLRRIAVPQHRHETFGSRIDIHQLEKARGLRDYPGRPFRADSAAPKVKLQALDGAAAGSIVFAVADGVG